MSHQDQPEPVLQPFMIRYRHAGEVIDVTGTGDAPKDAYQRYIGRLEIWGKDAKDYKFISAKPLGPARTGKP